MAGGMNLALKYAKEVDERWYTESQAQLALGGKYDFTGVKTVRVYSIPVATMNDYTRSGSNRYGNPEDLITVSNNAAGITESGAQLCGRSLSFPFRPCRGI